LVTVEIRSGIVIPPHRHELFELLAGLGYEPRDVPPIERRGAELVPLVIWVAENIGVPAALEIVKVEVAWVRRRVGARADDERVQVIWGPEGEVLAEVRVRDAPREEDR
jgi:hypothetical protein